MAASCDIHPATLWSFLAGELAPDHHRHVQLHLTWCPSCCTKLARIRDTHRLLRNSAAVAIPELVQQRLERFVDQLDEPGAARSPSARVGILRRCIRGWPRGPQRRRR